MKVVKGHLEGDMAITSVEGYVGCCDVESCGLYMRISPGYMAHQGVMKVTGDVVAIIHCLAFQFGRAVCSWQPGG